MAKIYSIKTPSGNPVRAEEAWKDSDGNLLNKKATIDTAQTITGQKTFSQPVKADEIDNANGNALVRYKATEGKNVFGGVNYDNVLMGKSDRPFYSKDGSDFNGSEMALKSDVPVTYIETTYANLVSLRNNKQLVRGATYRITDYQCTTTQNDTQSANHQFDILVVADDVATLNENARALLHDGDTYFSQYGCKLEAWQLKYCLDNDTSRFGWADETNGKGVIHYMKDEFGNECHYDFKNIQFKRYLASDYSSVLADMIDGDWTSSEYLATQEENVELINAYDESDFKWCYTFCNSGYIDASLNGEKSGLAEEGYYMQICWGNSIGLLRSAQSVDEGDIKNVQLLNNIVFQVTNEDDTSIAPSKIYSNVFGDNCRNMTIAGHFHSNVFGENCYTNLFFKCSSNTFGNYCSSNTFGNYCSSNTFGNNCSSNTFGNYCSSNTFGNNCYYNTFGNDCSSNTFGNDCWYNTLLDETQTDMARYNILDNGVSYINLTTQDGSGYLQNVHIHSGVAGTRSSKKTIYVSRGLNYSSDYYATGSKSENI